MDYEIDESSKIKWVNSHFTKWINIYSAIF